MSLRRTSKHFAEQLLGRLLKPRRMAGRSLVLAYHNVVPDDLHGRGDQSLHLPFRDFVRQVDLLQTHCEVLTLTEILRPATENSRLRVAITFDDAYRGAMDLAVSELSRRGLPCTVFVAPGLLGAASFWWDELATGDGLRPKARHDALEVHAGQHGAIRAAMAGPAEPACLPGCYGCADEESLRRLLSTGMVTLGAHSWSHPNLTRLRPGALADELRRPLEWLGTVPGSTIPLLAYPYGSWSPEVALQAEQAGYAAALRIEGGWFDAPPANKWAVPRFNVPAGISADGFLLRLSGLRQ